MKWAGEVTAKMQRNIGKASDNFKMGAPSIQRGSHDIIDKDMRDGQQLGRFSEQQLGRFNKQQLGRLDKQMERLDEYHMDSTQNRTFRNNQIESDSEHSHDESGTESSGETTTASSIAVLAERLGVDTCKRDTAEITPDQMFGDDALVQISSDDEQHKNWHQRSNDNLSRDN